jgi:hypothetical protein
MDLEKLLATVTAKKAELSARSGKNNVEKFPPGRSRWRILPGWRKHEDHIYFHEFGQHWFKDADGNVLGVTVCEAKTSGAHCDCCDAVADAMRSTRDDKAVEALREMQGRGTILVNALRQDGENKSSEPKLLGLPLGVFESLAENITTFLADGVNLLSLEEGHDIFVSREGTGKLTKYEMTVAPKSTKVDPSVLGNLINIDAWIEAERQKGIAKGGVSLAASATRALTGAPMLSARSALTPPKAAATLVAPTTIASTVIASRTIEEADEIPFEGAGSSVSVSVEEKKEAIANEPLKDEDLEKLLETLV